MPPTPSRPTTRTSCGRLSIESDKGFEIGIELVAKARRARLPVAELPTIWLDRAFGASNFKLAAWLPRYLRWYLYAFGPRRDLAGHGHQPCTQRERTLMSKVLVTGSAGFIGGYLVEELLGRGYEVVGIDNLLQVRHGRRRATTPTPPIPSSKVTLETSS